MPEVEQYISECVRNVAQSLCGRGRAHIFIHSGRNTGRIAPVDIY